MNYTCYGCLTFVTIPLIIVFWLIFIVYKIIDKKVDFDKEGGNYIRLQFDYKVIVILLIISSLAVAIRNLKEQIWPSIIIVLLLILLSVGLTVYFIYDRYLKRKDLESTKLLTYKRLMCQSTIIISIDLVLLEIISYIFWKICVQI